MVSEVKVDKAGRIVLPKPMRDELRLEPGDALEVESLGDRIVLRRPRANAQMRKKHGIWVFRSGETITPEMVEKTDRQIEAERDREIWGDE
jgi:AbrB family looped-hinge helix DNA binding protein